MKMLLSGVITGEINECLVTKTLSYKIHITRQYTVKKLTHQEQWTVIVSYARFRALQEYYQHMYPQVKLPHLPSSIKLSSNQNQIQTV